MKSAINYVVVLLLFSLGGCSTAPAMLDSATIVVVDRTDPPRVYPDAEQIAAVLGLKTDIWQSAEIIITDASDKDINNTKVISLEKGNQWTGNVPIRKAHIAHFIHQLKQALPHADTGSMTHSIIGTSIIKAANRLVRISAHQKRLLIYSDLMENTNTLNFYHPEVRAKLATNRDSIKHYLERNEQLDTLNGLDIWLLYAPPSYKVNNVFMEVATFYQQWFKQKGATVHIEIQVTPL
jgi:hypothetical protein